MEIKMLSVTEQIVDTLLSGIRKGTFKLGQRLPSQREMVELFGASRTSVREAIKILEGRDIVQSKRGSGIFVCTIPDDLALNSLGGNFVDVTTSEVLEFARAIWYASVEETAKNASDEEINIVHSISINFYKNYKPSTTFQERYIYETSFGMNLCKYSHNPINYMIMLELLKITSDVDYKVVSDSNLYRKILEVDLNITESLMERDRERALFWSRERDRHIQSMIRGETDIMQRKYRIDFSFSLHGPVNSQSKKSELVTQ